MKKQFQSLTEKGRWLLATLTLIFTLGIGQMWGAGTALSSLNFSNPSSLPSAFTYSSDTPPTQGNQTGMTGEDANNLKAITLGSGGGTAPTTFSATDAAAPSGGKRWIAFQPAEDCTLKITVGVVNSSRTFYLLNKDHKTTSNNVSSYAPSARYQWYDDWEVELTGGTWYAIIGSGSNCFIHAMQFTASSGGGCTADPAVPTKFEASSITDEGVTFSITDAANASSYDIYYSTSSATPEATATVTATSTAKTKAITGLTASTQYYAWVRSVCDASHKSAWVALDGASFTTAALGADLTAHTPGVYEKAQANGGYGAGLITYSNRQYETYYVSYNNSKLSISAGNIAYNAEGHYNLIDNVSTSADVEVKGSDWFGIAANSYGNSGTTNKNQFNKNASTHAATLVGANKVRLKVSGYDNFSFIGRDGSTSGENMFVVKIDGETKTVSHTTTDNSIYSFDISTGEHYIEVTTNGGGSNRFRGFSLRLPQCGATAPGNISKGTLSAGVLTLNVADDPASGNKYYWQTSANGTTKVDEGEGKNEGKSYNVNAVGTYYVRSYYAADDCWSAAKSFTVAAADLVANYTVIYKDGTTELGNEVVEVGEHPTGIADPEKDCYTFAGWLNGTTPVADVTALSGSVNDVITLTATWTPKYASTIDFEGNASVEPEVVAFAAGYNYLITNLATESEWDHGAKTGYVGYKLKDSGATIKFLAPAGKQVVITLGSVGDPVTLNKGGVASTIAKASGDNAKTVVPAFIPEEDMIVSLTTTSGSTVTLKKIAINTVYSVTLVDAKSNASADAAWMVEKVLPTPTAVSGYTFLGWKANQDVTIDSEVKTTGTILAAGSTAVLSANTTFTAQWQNENLVAMIGDEEYTSLADALNAIKTGAATGNIVLRKNVEVTSMITLDYDVTIDLNGYKLSSATGNKVFEIINSKTLTIIGTTANSEFYGRINVGAAGNNNGHVILNGGYYHCTNDQTVLHINGECMSSNVTMDGVTILSPTDNGIQLNGKGVFNISNSTITGATGIYIKSGVLTLTDCTVTGNKSPVDYSYNGNGANATGDGIVVDACNYPGGAPTINIVSGTYTGTKSAVGNYNYQGTSEPAVGGISGGTYNTPVPAALCADTYVPTPTGINEYGVIVGKLVKYVANGGTGEMVELGYAPATDVTVLANGFTAPANKKFDKWAVTGLTVTEAVAGDVFEMPDAEVTLTAQWIDAFTVTYNANGGTCATTEAAWAAGDEQLVLPTATKSNYVITGWYDSENHLVGRAGGKYTPTASIELFAHYVPNLYEASYSNHFDGFINAAAQTITVYYLEGESAPTLSSIKVLGVSTPAFIDNGDNVVITVDAVDYTFEVTKTAVEAYAGTGLTFGGTESYVKTGNAFSTGSKQGWVFARNHKDADGEDYSREAAGKNRIYFFLGAAQEIKLTSGVNTARPIKVYRNGVEVFSGNMPKSSDATNYITFNGANSAAMYALVSNQSSGDGAVSALEITPWVPVESIVLKEGTTAISSKEIAEGAQFTLTAEVIPANASNPTIVWESENADIASVAGGVVTGVASGSPVNIIARSQDNNTIYATCAVTVAAPCTPSMVAWNVEPADGVKGGNGSASVTTNYAAGLEVTSSDPTVASVSNDGVNITINYLKKGTTKITATVVGDGSNYCNTPVSVEKTITVEPDCPAVGNLFSLEFKNISTSYAVQKGQDNEMVEIPSSDADITGGKAFVGTTSNSTGQSIAVTDGDCKFGTSSNYYVRLEVECPLQIGDIISYTSSSNKNLNFYKDNMSGTSVASSNYKVTVATGSPLIGAEVIYIKRSNSANTIMTLSIDRPAQITLNGNGGKIGDETSVVVPAVGATQLPNARKDGDFYFVGWSTDPEGNNMVANPYTPTATTVTLYAQYDDCVAQGTVYKFEVATRASGVYIFENGTSFPASAAMTTDNYLSTLVGGDLTASVTSSSGNYQNIYIDNSGVAGVTAFMTQSSYGVLTMDLGCPLKAGDVIRYNIVSDSGKKLTLKDDNSHSVNIFGNNANEVDEINVPADFVGATQLTLNYNGGACRIASFEVYRRPALTGISLANATVAVGAQITPAMTMIPDNGFVADPVWKWSITSGSEYATINATTGAVTGVAPGDATVLVELEGRESEIFATCNVHVIQEYVQTNVEESIVWDWSKAGVSDIQLSDNTDPKKYEWTLLAKSIAPNPNFASDKLMMSSLYLVRNSQFCQGQYVKFNTTVPGTVKVTFGNTGNNGKRTVRIAGKFDGNVYSTNSGNNNRTTYIAFAPAGEVLIEAIQLNDDGTFKELSNVQIDKIEFNATPDYTRNVSNNIGTLCVDHNVVVGGAMGATFYQIASRNQLYDYKIDFEEVLPNEELKAGEPYIFQSNTGKIELFYGETEADAPVAVRGMIGSFVDVHVDITSENMSDILYIAKNKLWNCEDLVGGYLEVIENRAYIVMSDVPTYADYVASQNSNNAPRRRVTLGKDEAQVVTGFGELETSETPVKVLINGQIFIIRGEKMFDVTGKLVK